MPISTADKLLRLSLTTFPFINESQFFPALSTYKVDKVFDLAQFEEAMAHFFRGNPLFSKCHLIELTFDSPQDFPLSSFQDSFRKNMKATMTAFWSLPSPIAPTRTCRASLRACHSRCKTDTNVSAFIRR